MELTAGIPLTKAIKTDIIPLDKINPPQDLIDFLDKILVTGYEDEIYPNSEGGRFEYTLSTAEEAVLELPAIEGFALVFGGQEGNLVTLGADMRNDDYAIKFGGGLRIRVSRSVLKPVIRSNGEWIDDPANPYAYIPLSVAMIIDSDWNVSFEGTNEFSVGPAMVGDSGFVIEGTLAFDFSEDSSLPETIALGLGDSWQGAIFKTLTLHLPDALDIPIVPSDLTLTDFHIGSGGISGSIAGNWSPTINGLEITGNGAGELFGMAFGLKSLSVSLIQNSFTGFELKGALGIPFFESAIDVTLGIDHEGNINVALDSEDGLASLTIPEVLELELSSIGFEIEDDIFIVKIGGKLTPLLAGIDWPAFELEELSVDSKGNVKIEGGWIDIPDQYSIDFFGFQMEITQIGFGSNDDESKWLGFSGGIKLVDGFQAGASVEGLRITWGKGDPKVSFNGIGVEFEVPNAVRFQGEVSFREFEQINPVSGLNEKVQRFDGEISLELIALNLQIDANLVIGSAQKPDGSSYTFFAIYLGVELPAGIPLFSTGLALYGLAGLFALQMEPNKTPDEVWYGIGEGEGWFKKPEVGVTDLKNKWVNVENSFALGAGITIGTLPDNGFTFSGKFLLVLVIPGPIIMLEGKANMLKQRSELDEEPIFRSLAVLDGREGSFLFGLDAQYKFGDGGELIEIGGGVEAFFSFSDPMAWHLYIGLKEPREKRIRAEIFQLFEANAYFMLDAYKLAMGAWVGYDKRWSFGPLKVTLEAWLEHNVILSWNPVFLYGDIWAHGKAELSVFGFGLGLSIDARLAGQVFDPFWIKGSFEVGINLPWPLPDFSVDISVQWGPKKVAPPIPAPLKEAAIEHLKVSTSWPAPFLGEAVNAQGIPTAKPADFEIPVVPLDARPNITFNKSMHDTAMVGVNIQNPTPEFEIIGDAEKNEGAVEVKYKLDNVVLQRFDGGTYQDIAGKNLIGIPDIFGSWAPEPKQISSGDPEGLQPGQSKLLVWSKTPYSYNRQIDKTWDEWFEDTFENYPCPQLPKDKEFCYDFEDIPEDKFFLMFFSHPENENLRLLWLAPTFNTVERLNSPLEGKNKAFCFPRGNNSEFIKLDNNFVILGFPEPVRKVKLCLRSNDEVLIQAVGIDTQNSGQYVNLGSPVPAGAGQPDEIIIEFPLNVMYGLLFSGSFCLSCICYTVGASPEDAQGQAEALNHLNSEMARWAQEGDVLEPFSSYRVKIISGFESRAKDSEYAGDPDFNRTESFENYIYFRTEGPPGLVALSPANNPASASGEGSNEALETLGLYVSQTIPASVPAPGEKPPLPKPVYRSYDVGVDFNEDYVELMYKISERDLGLYLFDNNEEPLRDVNGKLVVLSNQWGKTEELTLLESESRYIDQVNEGDCTSLDTSIIPKDSALSFLAHKFSMIEDTLYEARLIPLLFQDDFFEERDAWAEDTEGNTSAPANWSRQQHETVSGSGITVAGNSITLQGNPDLSSISADFDSIVLEGDALRPSGTYKILEVDNTTKQLTLDAAPSLNNPATTDWSIPAIAALVQSSNVHGGMLDANSPDKKGTILYLKDRNHLPDVEQPSKWTNYRFTTVLRPMDDDAIGVVFRYRNQGGNKAYYRFAMNKERKYRRLVKVINNNISILAQDNYLYNAESDYAITVEAMEDSLRIYSNGKLVFNVTDQAIDQGSVGLYCWAQQGARFDNVRIDDFRTEAKAVYRFNFTTGYYTNFFHHLHSFLDETWLQAVPAALSLTEARNASQPLSAEPDEDVFRAYEKLATGLLGGTANSLVPEVQFSRLVSGDQTIGWLVQSPEPLLWERIGMQFKRSSSTISDRKLPKSLKLTHLNLSDSNPDDEYVELLQKDHYPLNGVRVEYPGFSGVPLTDSTELLFEDNFDYLGGVLYRERAGNNALDNYEVFTETGISGNASWGVSGTSIVQNSNVFGGSFFSPERAPGAVALIGGDNWNNIRIKLSLKSTDDDGIGLVFRYQDEDNFCRFVIDRQRSFRRIVQVTGGEVVTLWEDNEAYVQNVWHEIEVFIFESSLMLYLNNQLLFQGDVLEIEKGRIGYYSWANTGSYFKGLEVYALSKNPLLYSSDFQLETYEVVDEPNTIQGPSEWEVEDQAFVQRSNIHSRGNFDRKRGTFALLNVPLPEVTRTTLSLQSDDNDILGIVFRVQQASPGNYNYYRFTMDRQTGKRRLERKLGNSFTLLWQDNFTYLIGQWYELTLDSTGPEHTLYLDGNLLTTFTDSALRRGGLGLFSWANRGARFKNVKVVNSSMAIGPWEIWDEGTISAPSEWYTDGQVFGQRNNIHTNNLPMASGTMVIAGDLLWKNYSLTTTVTASDNDAVGVIFRYQDAQNYYRFSMDRQRNYRRLCRIKDGICTVLSEVAEGFELNQSYELTVHLKDNEIRVLLDGEMVFTRTDNSFEHGKIGLYNWAMAGVKFDYVQVTSPTLEVYRLFSDRFRTDGTAGWTVSDFGNISAPSNWAVENGVLRQTSNIHNAVSNTSLNKRGTIITAGDSVWDDFVFSTMMRSDSNDEFGIVFRYQNAQNHYRFTMDRERRLRRLTQVKNGTHSLLWEDSFAFEMGLPYHIVTVLKGEHIAIYINDILAVSVEASAHTTGKIGFHCWASENTSFYNVNVYETDVLRDRFLLEDTFDLENRNTWFTYDEGTNGTSDWQQQGGKLVQLSNIWGGGISANTVPKPGTYAICDNIISGDFRIEVPFETADNDAVGVVFGYKRENEFYRFSMDDQRQYRRLVHKTEEGYQMLWQDNGQGYDSSNSQVITIDILASVATIYLNGVKLSEVVLDGDTSGNVGLYTWASAGAAFQAIRVKASEWKTHFRFSNENLHEDGTRFRIYSGNQLNASENPFNVEKRYAVSLGDVGNLNFRSDIQRLRLVTEDGECLHETVFKHPDLFTNESIRVLRKRDGTGFFIFRTGTGIFSKGDRQLRLSFKRNNTTTHPDSPIWKQAGDDGDENVVLNIPWSTNL